MFNRLIHVRNLHEYKSLQPLLLYPKRRGGKLYMDECIKQFWRKRWLLNFLEEVVGGSGKVKILSR